MRTVELFSGIGGFRIACDRLGIETVWANDIDDKASIVYKNKFANNVHVKGDLSDFIDDVPEHDLLTAGFPCQPFSSAGKKLGVSDVRGTLFEKIVYILEKKQPSFFVLENVKRLLSMDKGKHFATIISALSSKGYLVEWRLLNASNFGLPQNRERVIITGRKSKNINSYLCLDKDFSQVKDKDLEIIKDVSSWCLINEHGKKFFSWGLAVGGLFCQADLKEFSEARPRVLLSDVLEKNPDDVFFFNEDSEERVRNSVKVDRYYNGVQILYNQKGGARMGYSIFGVSGLAPTLTCTTSRHYERYKIGNDYRRLTNIEYARIQGFPDDHCDLVSRYSQYSLYGNAVPPNMVEWVIDRLLNNKRTEIMAPIQGSFI